MSCCFEVRILGCGSSGGVPRLGSGWGACDPANPKNRRRRCSILLSLSGENKKQTRVLIDATPDMREQLLDHAIDDLDALVLTHAHADHIHGIDDIRPLVIHNRRKMSLYADKDTMARLKSSFGYILNDDPKGFYPAIAEPFLIESGVDFIVQGAGGDLRLLPFEVDHGAIKALGFRLHDFAYLPDVSWIPKEAEARLQGLDCLILDALRYQAHGSHFNLEMALEWIDRLKPNRAILTNMHPDFDYDRLMAETPDQIEPAYDGMSLSFLLK